MGGLGGLGLLSCHVSKLRVGLEESAPAVPATEVQGWLMNTWRHGGKEDNVTCIRMHSCLVMLFVRVGIGGIHGR